jgi:hypothetical protein
MTYNMTYLPGQLPDAAKRVELCHDHAKTTVWLELTNTDYIVDGSSNTFVTALIGAVPNGKAWAPIDFGDAARLRGKAIVFGNALGSKVADFQRAICRSWTREDLSGLAKGLTIGHDKSSAAFIMKALKTGFDAIGMTFHAYNGLRMKGFTVDEVVTYLTNHTAWNSAGKVVDGGLLDFEEKPPAPGMNEDRANADDKRTIDYIRSTRKHGGRFAYSAETDAMIPAEFTRVIAYGYRGDNRPPSEIKSAGGFNSNYTRPSHIRDAQQKQYPQDQALNIETFLQDQFYGGYISVSRAYGVAKAFACGLAAPTTPRGPGWVYACFVEGGFLIPLKGKRPYTLKNGTNVTIEIKNNEQEISMPGLLDWDDVVACRRVDGNGKFEGNVFIRSSLLKDDAQAADKIWKHLSGETQG